MLWLVIGLMGTFFVFSRAVATKMKSAMKKLFGSGRVCPCSGLKPRLFLILLFLAFMRPSCALQEVKVSDGGATEPAGSGSPLLAGVLEFTVTNTIVRPYPTNLLDIVRINPSAVLVTNSEGQVSLRYNYFPTNDLLNQARPLIEVTENGAIARNGQHTVEFDGNLNTEDAVVIRLPNGKVLQGRPAALSVSDGKGQRLWLGHLKDSQGHVVEGPESSVIYEDAFQGIKADVLYTYHLNFFEQDIIFREQPGLPAGIDEDTARLEVWTEFFDPPAPLRTRKDVVIREKTRPDAQDVVAPDETLDFGSMRIVSGKAFHSQIKKGSGSPREHSPVVKAWLVQEGRTFLLESVDYIAIKPQLNTLESREVAVQTPVSTTNMAFLGRSAAERNSARVSPGARSGFRGTRTLASLSGKQGVVVDYRIVINALLNLDFGGSGGFSGPAAAGKSTIDHWNLLNSAWSSYSVYNNLLYSEGASYPAPVQATLANAPGQWGKSPMRWELPFQRDTRGVKHSNSRVYFPRDSEFSKSRHPY
jgi:hypothetical protein